MTRLTLASLVVTALLIVSITAIMATSALAEPTVKQLSGESSKVTTTGEQKGADTIQSTGGGKITATLSKLEFVWLSLFPEIVVFRWVHEQTGAKDGTTACHTAGQPAETVVLKGEGHPVFRSLAPLKLGWLVSLAETTITCGLLEVKVKGSLLEAFNGTLGSDITSFKDALKGSKGKPELTKYFNSEGKEVTAVLLTNFETGFKESDMNIEQEVEDHNSSMLIVEG